MTTLDVIAISRSRGTAVLSDGTQRPVATWVNADSDDCDPGDALVAIVEVNADCWIEVDLSEFDAPTYH